MGLKIVTDEQLEGIADAIRYRKDDIDGEGLEFPNGMERAILEILPGGEGKSAYQIAVENGFVGTEKEWLESLSGVYVGEGDAPEPYKVQIDPLGEGDVRAVKYTTQSLTNEEKQTARNNIGAFGVEDNARIVKETLTQAKESGEFEGADGITPHIGANDNWFIGSQDTGVKAEGTNGENGEDGTNWYVCTYPAGTDWYLYVFSYNDLVEQYLPSYEGTVITFKPNDLFLFTNNQTIGKVANVYQNDWGTEIEVSYITQLSSSDGSGRLAINLKPSPAYVEANIPNQHMCFRYRSEIFQYSSAQGDYVYAGQLSESPFYPKEIALANGYSPYNVPHYVHIDNLKITVENSVGERHTFELAPYLYRNPYEPTVPNIPLVPHTAIQFYTTTPLLLQLEKLTENMIDIDGNEIETPFGDNEYPPYGVTQIEITGYCLMDKGIKQFMTYGAGYPATSLPNGFTDIYSILVSQSSTSPVDRSDLTEANFPYSDGHSSAGINSLTIVVDGQRRAHHRTFNSITVAAISNYDIAVPIIQITGVSTMNEFEPS